MKDNKEISEKVISLLKACLARKYVDFELDFDKEVVEYCVPDIKSVKFLRENEVFQTFLFFNKINF